MFQTPKFLWFAAPHMFPEGSMAKKAAIENFSALKFRICSVGISVGITTMLALLDETRLAYAYGGISIATMLSLIMFMREVSAKTSPFIFGNSYTEEQVATWQEACSAHSLQARINLCLVAFPLFLAHYIYCQFKPKRN